MTDFRIFAALAFAVFALTGTFTLLDHYTAPPSSDPLPLWFPFVASAWTTGIVATVFFIAGAFKK